MESEIELLEETAETADTRFDGKRIYKFMGLSRAIFVIRGKYIHKLRHAQPEYEISGNYIVSLGTPPQPVFEICGNMVRKLHSKSQAVYEIR